jgi:hypothetical protein
MMFGERIDRVGVFAKGVKDDLGEDAEAGLVIAVQR